MEIKAVSGRTLEPPARDAGAGKAKEILQNLGKAIEAGDLTSAKSALDQLQKNAPAGAKADRGQLGEKMDALAQAVDSGDVKAAQSAYAEVKKAVGQGAGGRPARAAGGPPPSKGASQGSSGAEGTEPSSVSSIQTYDVKDTNQDGKVSPDEEMAYVIKQSEERVKKLPAAERQAIDTWA